MSRRCIYVATEMWQSAHEAIERRVIQLGRHDAGPVGGQTDLLLVMRAPGQFAGGIEPVPRFASPATGISML